MRCAIAGSFLIAGGALVATDGRTASSAGLESDFCQFEKRQAELVGITSRIRVLAHPTRHVSVLLSTACPVFGMGFQYREELSNADRRSLERFDELLHASYVSSGPRFKMVAVTLTGSVERIESNEGWSYTFVIRRAEHAKLVSEPEVFVRAREDLLRQKGDLQREGENVPPNNSLERSRER